MTKTCATCAWLSTGYNDARGYGWCYSEDDNVDADGSCAHWQASLRDEPVNEPPLYTPFPGVGGKD